MGKQICARCMRRTECYTKEGLKTLDKAKTHEEMMGYECGVIFKNFTEAREFIKIIGDVISSQSKRTQNKIIKQIAEQCGTEEYFVLLELLRQ